MDIVRFSWERDAAGYEIVDRPAIKGETLLGSFPGGTYVKRRGGVMEPYEPLKTHGLYRRLADTDKTPEGALSFIKEFGNPNMMDADEYDVERLYPFIENMKEGISLTHKGEWGVLADAFNSAAIRRHGFGHMTIGFDFQTGDKRPTITLRPRSLISAIWLQFALDCSGGAKLRKCRWCPEFFKYGPGTGHRNTAVYCSPKCQKAHAYARREEATQ